ncbi:hypothetical protein CPL00159_CDS0054 [Escherichia phage MikeNSara]|jgi:hypothetical protein|uniref:Translocation/assembly module n=1 Tax=Escherichia phage JLBYU26 TaxID=2894742 RepID=A0AAE8YXX0_9CAUD|nr:putative translocation/assembly module [Escherichia phage JLBYU26]UGO56893.1 putative translocation/assembly module [Escherichia phage JLBYU19]
MMDKAIDFFFYSIIGAAGFLVTAAGLAIILVVIKEIMR